MRTQIPFSVLLMRIIISSLLVMLLANILPGVYVDSFLTSVWVAIVLAILNIFVKPLLVILTIPLTVFTLGLFLLVINGLIILLCEQIVGGFHVKSFGTALLFSLILSFLQALLFRKTSPRKE
jgi:putative membrane protein